MRIRPEVPGDYDAVDQVVEQAFGRADEARLVRSLRDSDGYVPALSLVADVDGEVLGHVMLSYVDLGGSRVLCLAPLAVRPDAQRDGIGIALTEAALEAAEAMGSPLVIVTGHPTYYPRFGFVPARPLGIEPPDPVPDEAFMVKRLASYDPALRGRVAYPAAWDVL